MDKKIIIAIILAALLAGFVIFMLCKKPADSNEGANETAQITKTESDKPSLEDPETTETETAEQTETSETPKTSSKSGEQGETPKTSSKSGDQGETPKTSSKSGEQGETPETTEPTPQPTFPKDFKDRTLGPIPR